jgi:CubicO group peptidase (beta-lactamase class C family)
MSMNLAAQVDEYMRARVALEHFSGTVCIARAGETLFSQGYGLANREHGVPNTPQTKFRLASVTKQFTATAIMQLQQQGKLRVHDQVGAHLDECPPAWDAVTIHHLLNHTSGIPSHTNFPETWATIALPKTVAELIASFRDRPLEFAPGQRWSYNNSGYILLGAIIEQITGRSYEQVVREQIFEPLGMHDSGYDRQSTILPGRAAGYIKQDGTIVNAAHIDMSIPYAAGALYSTVGDLCLWDRALASERLIPQELLATMFAPTPIAEPPGQANYGYGWAIDRLHDRRYVGHDGGIFGFSTRLMRFLDEHVLLVLLSNLESPYIAAISRDLSAMVFGEPYTMPGTRQAITLDPQLYDRYIGEYAFEADGNTHGLGLTRDGNRLIAQIAGDPPFELLPESEHEFFAEAFDDRFMFVLDPQNQVAYMIMEMGGRRVRVSRVGEAP